MVRGDLSDPSTLKDCLEDVDAVLLIWRSSPTEAVPALMQRIAQHARRIVFLSGFVARDDLQVQTDPVARMFGAIETGVKQSGLEWTIIRSGPFAANALSWWKPQILRGDVVRWPYGGATYAPIHEWDVAAVATRALTENGHSGETYMLSGRELLSHAEQVRTIGEVIGRPLHFEEMPAAVARQRLGAFMPSGVVEHLLEIWSRMTAEPLAATTTVAELTGTAPRSYREWAIDHARDFQSAAESPLSAAV
jgi:uncharacterized protein YbjT (DUF2867 family)